MTKPTPQEFCAAYEPEYLMDEWVDEFETANDREPTEDEYDAQYKLFGQGNFEIVETELTYGGGDPVDVFIVKDKRTGQHYRTEIYHDSWGGSFEWQDCEFTEVEKREVLREEWFDLET